MTLGTSDKPLDILLVEDAPGDARLTQEMIKEAQIEAKVTVIEDGETAMAFLRREGDHTEAARPNLIMLDLVLPKKDGLEVLAEINADTELSTIPVFVLTGTDAEAAVVEEQSIPPSQFFRKPIDAERFSNVVRVLDRAGRLEPGSPAMEVPVAATPELSGAGKKWWWPFG